MPRPFHNATRDRFALDLRERHGLTMAQIAALLSVSRPRVHQLVERARYARLVVRSQVRRDPARAAAVVRARRVA